MEIIKCIEGATLLDAVTLFNDHNPWIIVVVNAEDQLVGTLNIRDVRSALLADTDTSAPVTEFMNKKPIAAFEDSDIEKLAGTAGGYIPVLDRQQRVKSIYRIPHATVKKDICRDDILQKIIVSPSLSIKKVMNILDTTALNLVLVIDRGNKFLGLVTERDIRNAIIEGYDSDTEVGKVMNRHPVTGLQGLPKKELLRLMDSRVQLNRFKVPVSKENLKLKVPILDEDSRFKGLAINDELDPEKTLFFVGDDDALYKTRVQNVLITGGAGYIGSILCRKLLKKGYNVRVLDNLIYGDDSIRELYANTDFQFIKGDIRHIEDTVSAIRGMDAVIHLAAIVGDPACSLDPTTTIEHNYLASKLLAHICKYHQVNRFIFSSTCSVYGASSERLTENSALNPVSLYARSKIYAENAILRIMDENFSPTILRLGTIFGISPRPRFDLVLNLFVARAIKDGEIEIEGGEQVRPLVHVADVADAFITCIEAPMGKIRGQIFNIGSNEQNIRIRDLGEEVIRHIPGAMIKYSESKNDNRDYWVYFDKIRNTLSYNPRVSIAKGIEGIIEFLKASPEMDYRDPQYYNHQILTREK